VLGLPYELQIRKGKDRQDQIFACCVFGNKGQFVSFAEACPAWLAGMN
jgi:hypothetical protein